MSDMHEAVKRIFKDAGRADLPKKMRRIILRRQNDKCFYCGRKLQSRGYVLDHFIPRSKGGEDEAENRVAACPPCDGKKGARMPTEAERNRLTAMLD